MSRGSRVIEVDYLSNFYTVRQCMFIIMMYKSCNIEQSA